jgi:hypothetical protein
LREEEKMNINEMMQRTISSIEVKLIS